VIPAKLLDYLAGNLSRRTLLGAVFPCMCVSYFGMLVLAVRLFPRTYDWRVLSISQLLYPRNNPTFYAIAASGVAVTGMLMIPFAGYLQRRLRTAAPRGAKVGAVSLVGGAMCMILAGLVSSHPLNGPSSVPKLHSYSARTAALAIGLGLTVFALCGLKGYLLPAPGRKPYPRSLLIVWSLPLVPAIAFLLMRLAMVGHMPWLQSIRRSLAGSVVWHAGFWEWTGSVIVALFLGCAVWLLPEHARQ
jgi:hypothetical protein